MQQPTSKYRHFLITTAVDITNAGRFVVNVKIDHIAPGGSNVLDVISKVFLPDAHETKRTAHHAGLAYGKAWIDQQLS
jgi:hypothetical protein